MTQPTSNNPSAPLQQPPVRTVKVPMMHRVTPEVTQHQFSDQQIAQRLETTIVASETIDQLLKNISQIVMDQSDCMALWACQANEAGEFGSAHLLTQSEGDALWPGIEDRAREMINRVSETRQICSLTLTSQLNAELVVAPISSDVQGKAPIRLVLIGFFSSEDQSVLRQQWLAALASQTISRWLQHRSLKHQEVKSRSLSDAIGLIRSLDQTTRISDASVVVANHLRRNCQADQVAISFCNQRSRSASDPGSQQVTLNAISGVERVDLSSESSKITNNACQQSVLTGQPVWFPVADAEHTPALLALEKYCKSHSLVACVSLPLITEDNRTIGAILVACTVENINDENYRQYLSQMVQMATGHLDVVIRANRGVRDIIKDSIQQVRNANLLKPVLIGIACLTALMCVPLPYRVGCDCEVQPVTRRFIASPYDGILQQAIVESGDLIESNQVVAQMDGRQLRIELFGLQAEYDGARKQRDSALAQGDIAHSQMAKSEMKRHQSKIDILQQQLADLEVRSPIAGIVVSEDLEKVEGAPVEMGQTLFEIAPLDEMLAEIGVPESEINYIQPGMTVAIKLNAFPFKTWTGTIEKIHPRTEVIDDKSVFVASVKIENIDNQLRPGMQGSAKITANAAPIGWNLFHQSWESVRYWMIW